MEVWIGYVVGFVTIASAFIGVFVQIGKDRARYDETANNVAVMKAQLHILETAHNEHRVHVAKEYVTNGELRDAVRAVTESIDRLGRDLKDYVSALTKQAD